MPSSLPSTPKILVADDDPEVVDSTVLLLRSLGCVAEGVTQVDQILGAVEREQPDLLLQDIRMPGLNLTGLVASLRADDESAWLPIVFFSAASDLATAAARHDVSGYLRKPFSADELARLVRAVLGSPRSTSVDTSDLQRQVDVLFHDHWNLTTALNSYVATLRRTSSMTPDTMAVMCGLEGALFKLEAQTDQLRDFVQEVLRVTRPAVPPKRASHRVGRPIARSAHADDLERRRTLRDGPPTGAKPPPAAPSLKE